MRLRRRLPIIVVVLLVAGAVAFLVFLRKHAPPEPARLLPGADAYVYADLRWMRHADLAGKLPEVTRDPDYERFIQQTGFQFERDLDQAAFAIHYPPGAARGPDAQQPRFSEVLMGKFDGERVRSYLHGLAQSIDNYNSVDIYNIALEGRTLRVAMLGVDSVAASNHSDPQIIRGIIDRSRKLASPFGGPASLRRRYKDVPLASIAWGIFSVAPSSAPGGLFGLSFLFSKPATVVASLRYLGSVYFKVEAFTASDEDAKALTDRVGTFLNIFHSAEVSAGSQANDPDMRKFLDSLKVEQHGDRAELTASVSPGLIEKVLSESPAQLAPPAPPEEPAAAPPKPAPKGRSKKQSAVPK